MEAQGCVAGGEKATEAGIKLKIRMRSRDAGEGEEGSMRESGTVSGYSTGEDACVQCVCKVCNKSFSSSKALGAHMRVHSGTATERCPPTTCGKGDDVTAGVSAAPHQNRQPNRRRHIKAENVATEDSAGAQSAAKRKPSSTCVLCKKRFPSMKSLFGHMRCHPDRDWRGIQPPEKLQSSPSSTVSESEPNSPAVMPEKPIGMASWPVTVRKRKRSMADAGVRAEGDGRGFDDPVYHAAYDLLLLKNSAKAAGSDLSASRDEDAEYDEGGPDDRASKRRRKKKKIRALMDHSEKYRCNTCHKSFSSHQALGGHRTSHKKMKEEPPNGETAIKEVAEPLLALPWPEFDDDEVPTHQCQICFKSFPSGQALGGHKRCHWNEDRAAAAVTLEAADSSSVATTASEEQKRSSILPGFDLNEVAPLEDADLDSLYSMVDVVPAAAKLLGVEGSTDTAACLIHEPSP
ncbi:unnamed protein product [Victoria cruziana]